MAWPGHAWVKRANPRFSHPCSEAGVGACTVDSILIKCSRGQPCVKHTCTRARTSLLLGCWEPCKQVCHLDEPEPHNSVSAGSMACQVPDHATVWTSTSLRLSPLLMVLITHGQAPPMTVHWCFTDNSLGVPFYLGGVVTVLRRRHWGGQSVSWLWDATWFGGTSSVLQGTGSS